MHKPRVKDRDPASSRIEWARSLTNEEICAILQSRLLESRAAKDSKALILNELVHEIKYRLSVSDYEPSAPPRGEEY